VVRGSQTRARGRRREARKPGRVGDLPLGRVLPRRRGPARDHGWPPRLRQGRRPGTQPGLPRRPPQGGRNSRRAAAGRPRPPGGFSGPTTRGSMAGSLRLSRTSTDAPPRSPGGPASWIGCSTPSRPWPGFSPPRRCRRRPSVARAIDPSSPGSTGGSCSKSVRRGSTAGRFRHLDRLAALGAEAPAAVAGETLLHLDLRADNMLLTPDRVVVMDWPHARVSTPWVDLLFFARASPCRAARHPRTCSPAPPTPVKPTRTPSPPSSPA